MTARPPVLRVVRALLAMPTLRALLAMPTLRALLAGALAVAVLPLLATSAAASRTDQPGVLTVRLVPPLSGVSVQVAGRSAVSDRTGTLRVPVPNFVDVERHLSVVTTQLGPDRRIVLDRISGSGRSAARGVPISVGLRTSRLVSWRFIDRYGDEVDVSRVRSMSLRSSMGSISNLASSSLTSRLWLPASRTVQTSNGLVSKNLYYVVDSAVVDGTSVVNRAQQRFVPVERANWSVQLLFYKVRFTSSDLFFTNSVGQGIELVRPDGRNERLAFDKNAAVVVPDLPRGTYTVRTVGGGLSFARPVSISKDQDVALQVVSLLDMVVVAGLALFVAVGLILLGRPRSRPRLRRRRPRMGGDETGGGASEPEERGGTSRLPSAVGAGTLVLALAALLGAGIPAGTAPPAAAATASEATASVATAARAVPQPVLAYYYIWFTPTSWDRAKIDYPLLGRYSSDDREIMRRHILEAKAAGIDGFLVSWKHTSDLDRRLHTLASVARAENFKLGIVYQGLDFARNPLPLQTVRTDLGLFSREFASDPVFSIFDKPVVVWTGSYRWSAAQIASAVDPVRERLLVLGSAKSVADYEASAAVLNGNAYYWSSADPRMAGYAEKLAAMGRAVHRRGGLWIAPLAPGFDARLVGGSRAIDRADGQTLRVAFRAALASTPDALGVISWNEFSENSQIEPSERRGARELQVLASLLGGRVDTAVAGDSSEPEGGHWGLTSWGALVLLLGGLTALPLAIAVARRRRARKAADVLIQELDKVEAGSAR